jgi:hypothetical protein
MDVDVWSLVQSVPENCGEAEFIESWRPIADLIGPRSQFGEMALLEVMRDVATLQAGTIDPAWGGGWRWDMSSGAAKSVLATGLLYGVLVAAGVPGLLPLVIPAVLPLLFDIEKVRLSRSERNVINIIGARKRVFDRVGTVQELYASLPDDVRQSLSEHEFEEFIDAAINAGVASETGEYVEVLSTGQSEFRLKIV